MVNLHLTASVATKTASVATKAASVATKTASVATKTASVATKAMAWACPSTKLQPTFKIAEWFQGIKVLVDKCQGISHQIHHFK
jgi:phage-related tail protein